MKLTKISNAFANKLKEETEHITTINAILNQIEEMGEIYSTETARSRLDLFKTSMFYCSAPLSNPMCLEWAKHKLKISDELLYIHERMFHFLHDNKFLQFEVFRNIKGSVPKSFSWNIPKFFMPFLASYILAITALGKKESPTDFFTEMNKFFTSFSNSNNTVEEIYQDWILSYLGREYFCKLDDIYKNYARTSEEKEILRNSLYLLTRLLVESPMEPNVIPAQMNALLEFYELNLKKQLSPTKEGKVDLTILYPYESPCISDKEIQLAYSLLKTMKQLSKNLIRLFERLLNRNSKYKISVSDFPLFKEEYDNYDKNFHVQLDNYVDNIENTYKAIQNDFISVIEENLLVVDETSLNNHKELMVSAISKYKEKFFKKVSPFVKKVEAASKPQPEKSNSLYLDTDYFETLKSDLRENLITLKDELSLILEKKYFLFIRNEGLINSTKYPKTIFDEKTILRIITELIENYYCLPDNDIVSPLISTDFKVIASIKDLITILLDFDQMIP